MLLHGFFLIQTKHNYNLSSEILSNKLKNETTLQSYVSELCDENIIVMPNYRAMKYS